MKTPRDFLAAAARPFHRAGELLLQVKSRAGRSRRIRELVTELGPVRRRLSDFGRRTDEVFTALASHLGRLNNEFSSMQNQVRMLDEILHPGDGSQALDRADALCKSSIELVHASFGVAHSVEEQMASVNEELGRTCAMRESFDKSFLMLRNIAMGFRVEATRVDSEFRGIFDNVAAAISDIDRRITTNTRHAFGQIEALIHEADAERTRTGAAGTFAGAQASIESLRGDLEALHAALTPCAAAVGEIGGRLAGSVPQMMSVITALQYQDIVRQRLEHVGEGMIDIEATGLGAASGTTAERTFIGNAARIQLGQLRSARLEIERAGDTVTGGLDGLVKLGGDLLGRLNELETMVGNVLGSDRVSELFAREIGRLARVAEAGEMANRRVAGLVERIGAVISVFSSEIAKQEGEVKLIALNAQVAAARLPNAGALEKLAEETTRMARHNATISRTISSTLQETLGHLVSIRRDAEEFIAAVTVEKDVIERGASGIAQELRDHAESARRMSSALRVGFLEVHENVARLLGTVGFPREIESCFTPAETICRRIAGEAGGVATANTGADERLETHASRYTMEHERATHAAATESAIGVPAMSEAAAGGSSTDDIELF